MTTETKEKPQETNRERFLRLANLRVSRTLKRLRLVGNLSNKSIYEATPEEVDQIFATIQQAVDKAKDRFAEKPKEVNQDSFELKSAPKAA